MVRPKERAGRYMGNDTDGNFNEKITRKDASPIRRAQTKDEKPRHSESTGPKSKYSISDYNSRDSRDFKSRIAISEGQYNDKQSIESNGEKSRKTPKQTGTRSESRQKTETEEKAPYFDIKERSPSSVRQKRDSNKKDQTEKGPPRRTQDIKQREIKRELDIKSEPVDENLKLAPDKNKQRSQSPHRANSAKTRIDTITHSLRSPTVDRSKRIPESTKPSTGKRTEVHYMTVTIMNANGPSGDNGSEPAIRRKKTIYDVINKFSPDVVLFQEFPWKTAESANLKNFPKPKRFYYSGHYDAGLLIESKFDFEDIQEGKIDMLLERTYKEMKKSKLAVDENEFAPRPRMSMRRLKKKEDSKHEVIVISWHGRSNRHGGGGGLTVSTKVYLFRYLFEFLNQIRKEFNLPIIIGGDFNVEIDDIEMYVVQPFKLIKYKSSERRTKGGKKGIIDYYIATDDLAISGVKYIDLEKASYTEKPNQVLDHDPVFANVDLLF